MYFVMKMTEEPSLCCHFCVEIVHIDVSWLETTYFYSFCVSWLDNWQLHNAEMMLGNRKEYVSMMINYPSPTHTKNIAIVRTDKSVSLIHDSNPACQNGVPSFYHLLHIIYHKSARGKSRKANSLLYLKATCCAQLYNPPYRSFNCT